MKAKNYRVGNLIDYGGYLKPCEIVTIHSGGNIKVRPKNFSGPADETGVSKISPVPLSEELLLKFGFKTDDSGLHYIEIPNLIDAKMILYWAPDLGVVYLYDEENDINVQSYKYLHEVQNVFFALSNEELELKF